MEEKYLYTIAIIVIFAGFLFTSVGTYTGRPVVDVAPTLRADYSSDSRSSVTEGFSGQPKSQPKQVVGAGNNECLDVEEGNQHVIDRARGLYVTCSNGEWVTQSCPENNIAMQRIDGVSCAVSEYTN